MALLSDMDWLIILAVGGFLLLGKGDPQLLRTVGRWYGKVMHLKQKLLSEVTREAGIPNPSTGPQLSVRSALLGLDPPDASRTQVPIAVARAPAAVTSFAAASSTLAPAMTWVNSVGPHQWSIASTRFPEFDGTVH
jgi:Sec-independent protein translocase protein TatA